LGISNNRISELKNQYTVSEKVDQNINKGSYKRGHKDRSSTLNIDKITKTKLIETIKSVWIITNSTKQ
jgi:hypothetical protein